MTSLPKGVDARLEVPGRVQTGGAVRILLSLRNTSDQSVDLYLRGREITFDVIIENARGDVIWQRLEDAIVPAILQIRTLTPGEMLASSTTWDQRDSNGVLAPPGEYAVRALLLTESESVAAGPVALVIARR